MLGIKYIAIPITTRIGNRVDKRVKTTGSKTSLTGMLIFPNSPPNKPEGCSPITETETSPIARTAPMMNNRTTIETSFFADKSTIINQFYFLLI